jgi:hypothetical protein
MIAGILQAAQGAAAEGQNNVAFYGMAAVLLIAVVLLLKMALTSGDDDMPENG